MVLLIIFFIYSHEFQLKTKNKMKDTYLAENKDLGLFLYAVSFIVFLNLWLRNLLSFYVL